MESAAISVSAPRDVQRMDHRTNAHHIECQICSVAIDVNTVSPDRCNQTHSAVATEKNALNEVLVDYGWLPTSKGYYCRQHAPQTRVRLGLQA